MRWACDFETYPNAEKTWVWAWGASNIDNPDEFVYDSKISDFILWAEEQDTLYFHNLKFDGGFICDYLLKNNWEYVHDKPKKPNQFSALIANTGQWYSMSLNFNGNIVKIYDSLKKLPMSISAIAKSFNLEEMKGDIDYNLYRPEGWVMTETEKAYLKNDCVILSKALRIQFGKNLTKMTVGGDALSSFKEITDPSKFNRIFPLLSPEVDKECRSAYRGGWCYCHRPGEYNKTICFDVNSLYPYALTFPMPFGNPIYFKGEYTPDKAYPLYFQTFKADFKLKEGYLPTIQLKHSRFHSQQEYITEHFGMSTNELITLTSVDMEIFRKHYDIFEIEYIGGYKFKQIHNIFKPYIDYWMSIKESTTGGLRTLAKLMLNSLYGKFGKNPDTTRKDLELSDDKLHPIKGKEEISDTLYVPIACFTTAYARRHTITHAQMNYDRFIYSDTDSLHLIGDDIPDNIEVHDAHLGKWKVEYVSEKGKFIKQKRYCTCPKGKLKITCAGMPKNVKENLTYEDFEQGREFYGKLVPIYVPGGVYLKETTFRMD